MLCTLCDLGLCQIGTDLDDSISFNQNITDKVNRWFTGRV